jgi:hypothetical protein
VLVHVYYAFPKPSVHGFPTADDPADRCCRYLVQPPTEPSLARLRGYQRPLRGGRGRCRRACERTPLRGRRPPPGSKCIVALQYSPHSYPLPLDRLMREVVRLTFVILAPLHKQLLGLRNARWVSVHEDIVRGALRRRSGGGPGGGALAGPSASSHLPVVGDGNPLAVPCLAR